MSLCRHIPLHRLAFSAVMSDCAGGYLQYRSEIEVMDHVPVLRECEMSRRSLHRSQKPHLLTQRISSTGWPSLRTQYAFQGPYPVPLSSGSVRSVDT